MAPGKRQRPAHEDSDYEVVDVQNASASLQAEPVSEGLDPVYSEAQKTKQRKKARTSAADLQSDASEHNTDDESFLEQASQFVSQQKVKSRIRNTPADNGVIESVTCINFMCHKHFDVQLGPLINFITGHNGSGKSAILTAITICLGGKATSTNRGGSLKSFIMNGEESAMLSVKLKNTSDTAYQQDTYGDSIIVERHFSRSGASGFKLKSATGRLITTRKADLDDICDYFALQIDNPMNVLTQDMARQFLNNSTPYDKYKFFMKGTQLEHLDGDYIIVEQNVDAIDADLYKKMQDVEVYRDEAKKAQDLHRLAQKNDELQRKLSELGAKIAWVQIETQESEVQKTERDLQDWQEKLTRLQAECESLGEGYRQSDEANAVALRQVDEAKLSLEPLQEQKGNVKQEHDKHKRDQVDLQTQQREISNAMKQATARVVALQKSIDDEYQRLSDADGGRHVERLQEIEKRKAEAHEAKSTLIAQQNESSNLDERVRHAKQNHEDSKKPIEEKRVAIQGAENRLDRLMRDRGQQQNAYPAAMPRLLSAIRQDDGFREKPVGPIGKHVRLLKPAWSSILERQFGSTLDSFIVTSKSDQDRLSSLMKRIKCETPILIGNHDRIDTSAHEPDPAFETTLRIDNDLVRRQLIIGQGIEQTILIENRRDAVETFNGSRLVNVKQCFTHNVDPGTGLRLAYGPGGGPSQGFVPRFPGVPRMKTDVEYQISSQKESVHRLKTELNELEDNTRQKQAEAVRCQQAVTRHKRGLNQLLIDSQQAQVVVDELQDALEADSNRESQLDTFKAQLKEVEEEKSTHENSYEDSINAKDELYKMVRTTRDELANIDSAISEAEAIHQRAEMKAAHRAEQRDVALREKNKAEDSVHQVERQQPILEAARQTAVTILEDWTRQALAIHPRVPVDPGETLETVEKKHQKLQEDLKKAEQRLGGSREKLAADAASAHEIYQRARGEAQSVEELVQLLKTTLVNRRDRWRRFQKYITSRARIQFFYQLSERGFRGKLLANHKEKKLDLQVEPDETRANAKGRSTHGLSGGEKSFSTICLLLSMWEAMGAPVRCLDEFDVFMDSVNRDVSMDMLIRFARDSVGKQFILITPQNMSKINVHDEDITVVRMRDPVRGQQTIDFPVVS